MKRFAVALAILAACCNFAQAAPASTPGVSLNLKTTRPLTVEDSKAVELVKKRLFNVKDMTPIDIDPNAFNSRVVTLTIEGKPHTFTGGPFDKPSADSEAWLGREDGDIRKSLTMFRSVSGVQPSYFGFDVEIGDGRRWRLDQFRGRYYLTEMYPLQPYGSDDEAVMRGKKK